MTRWEYLTFAINYEKKGIKNWVVELENGSKLIGLQRILEAQGEVGWELVSLDVSHASATTGFGKWYIDPAAYRATFKRPIVG